jgi:hypothetical protein
MNDEVLTPQFRIIAAAIDPPTDAPYPSRQAAIAVMRSLKSAGYDIVPAKPGNVVEGNFRVGPRLAYDVEGTEPTEGSAAYAVTELLRDVLADARSGNIGFVAVTAVGMDGAVTPAWAGDFKPLSALAAVTDLRIRFEAAYLSATSGDGAE